MAPGQRTGLVGTNSISQNRARGASLQHILDTGGVITDAVSTQDWPGAANVDVSIVNWIKEASVQRPPRLDAVALEEPISASLRPWSLAVERCKRLPENEGFAFYGVIPGAIGFILDPDEAERLLAERPAWRDVIRPYLIGNDILKRPDQSPSRYIIDFAFRTLEEARAYPEILQLVRHRVKPQRDRVSRRTYRENWWRFSEPIREMRAALEPLSRYIAAPAQGKRFLFSWVDPWTCPSNLVTAFAFDDDYAMGVLSSSAHGAWALAAASTLEDRPRYTATSCFDTFPWPAANEDEREEIGGLARELIALRSQLCEEEQLGLTDLYNLVDEGGYRALAGMHRRLDRAVCSAYGWPSNVSNDADEIVRRLLELNLQVTGGGTVYRGPGLDSRR